MNMRFLVDECTGPRVASWLLEEGHEVFSVHEEAKGSDDVAIINIANEQDYIIITNDKDFGELAFKDNKHHKGIILLRLSDERSQNKIQVLGEILEKYSQDLHSNFVVATEDSVRIIRPKKIR